MDTLDVPANARLLRDDPRTRLQPRIGLAPVAAKARSEPDARVGAFRGVARLACGLAVVAGAAVAGAGPAAAQGVDAAQRRRLERAPGTEWVLAATLQRAFVPDEPDTTLLIASADRGPLHLEGRWNYEAIGAGAVFVGSNFRRYGEVDVTLVPMLGLAFGTLRAVVPAFEASVAWRALDAYLEIEYVRDVEDRTRSFAYAWSELAVSPGDGWRLGTVAQRSRRYASQRETQRGLFVQHEFGVATLGLFVFEPADASRRSALLTVGFGF
jgi:hypothetical protein